MRGLYVVCFLCRGDPSIKKTYHKSEPCGKECMVWCGVGYL